MGSSSHNSDVTVASDSLRQSKWTTRLPKSDLRSIFYGLINSKGRIFFKISKRRSKTSILLPGRENYAHILSSTTWASLIHMSALFLSSFSPSSRGPHEWALLLPPWRLLPSLPAPSSYPPEPPTSTTTYCSFKGSTWIRSAGRRAGNKKGRGEGRRDHPHLDPLSDSSCPSLKGELPYPPWSSYMLHMVTP